MKLEEIEAALNLKENRDKKAVLKAVHNLVKALEKGGTVQGRVQGRLHKISLSGGYGFEELESGLGHLFRDRDFIPEERMPKYREKYLRRVGAVLLIIFLPPKFIFLPDCYIEFVPPESMAPSKLRAFLRGLDRSFPNLKVSRVEYALDMFHDNPIVRRNLYGLIMAFLSIQYQRRVGVIENGETHARTFNIGRTKIYERGSDKDKKDQSWDPEDLDRLRIEHTSNRPQLMRRGINNLTDLLDSPRFLSSHKDRYNFQHFDSGKLPKFFERYNTDSFQEEKGYYRKEVNNITKYIKDFEPLSCLKKVLREAMEEFDRDYLKQEEIFLF
jgi:hypothetical protein